MRKFSLEKSGGSHGEGPSSQSVTPKRRERHDEALGCATDSCYVLVRGSGDRVGNLGILHDIPDHRDGRGRRRRRLIANIAATRSHGFVSFLLRGPDKGGLVPPFVPARSGLPCGRHVAASFGPGP